MCAVRDDLFSHVVPLKLNVRPVCMWSKFARFMLYSFDDTVVCVSSGCHIPHLLVVETNDFTCLLVFAFSIDWPLYSIKPARLVFKITNDLIHLAFVVKEPVENVTVYVHMNSCCWLVCVISIHQVDPGCTLLPFLWFNIVKP